MHAPPLIDGFALGARVATGPLAEVHRARRGDQAVALKLYRPGLGQLDARVHREREAQARVDHRSVGRLLDWGVLPDGTAFLASEWIDGERLEDRMTGALSWSELFPVVRAIGDG